MLVLPQETKGYVMNVWLKIIPIVVLAPNGKGAIKC